MSPLNGLIEYLYTLGLDLYPYLGGKLMWGEKFLKDLILVLLISLTAAALLRRAKFKFNPLFAALFAVGVFSFLLTLLDSPIFAFIGIRSLLPLMLFVTAQVFFEERDLVLITQALSIVIVILIPLALMQFVYGTTVYDYNEQGRMFGHFASRIFATFTRPGSFGLFLLVFIMFSFLTRHRFSALLITVSAGLLLLTGSGMSLVALFLFTCGQIFRMIRNVRLKMLLLAVIPAALPFASFSGYYVIPVITGRVSIWNSPLARLDMMIAHFRNSSLLEVLKGDGLGYCSNAALNLLAGTEMFARASIPDSLYLSLFSQVGLIGGLLFIALNIKIYLESKCRYKTMIPILMVTGLTMNLLELFPVNWLYMLLLGVCSKTVSAAEPAQERTPVNV